MKNSGQVCWWDHRSVDAFAQFLCFYARTEASLSPPSPPHRATLAQSRKVISDPKSQVPAHTLEAGSLPTPFIKLHEKGDKEAK